MRKILSLIGVFFLLFLSLVYGEAPKSDGIHKANYKTGELQYESMYKNGKLNGVTLEYNKKGEAVNKYIFKDDELIKKIEVSKERDVGPFDFLFVWKFWVPVTVFGLIMWRVITKFVFKNRPI